MPPKHLAAESNKNTVHAKGLKSNYTPTGTRLEESNKNMVHAKRNRTMLFFGSDESSSAMIVLQARAPAPNPALGVATSGPSDLE